jgi:hypothetical protein
MCTCSVNRDFHGFVWCPPPWQFSKHAGSM